MDHERPWPKWAATSGSDELPGTSAPEEQDVNPPWERPSMYLPVPPSAADTLPLTGPTSDGYRWGTAIEGSLPGMSIEDLTGTGRIPAIAPLRPGESAWRPGMRAPSASMAGARAAASGIAMGGDVEIDEQPSVQMRAMRAGNLARATMIVTTALALSKVFGLFRTSLFAYVFGAGKQADAYTYAFTIPDMIFTIVAGGALASAFIPVFASYMVERRDRQAAWKIASAAINIALVLVTGFAVIAMIFTPLVVHVLFGNLFIGKACVGVGGCEGPMVISLTRIMLLQPIFLGGATIAVGILQARQSFVLPAIGQVIYTVSMIGGIVVAYLQSRLSGQPPRIEYAAYGVVAGALLQFVIQIPGLAHAKMRYSLSLDVRHPGIQEIGRLMVPRLFNSVMLYISVVINRVFLSAIDINGQAYGYVTAYTLIMLPQAIFGMAVSQAAFPSLAAFIAIGQWDRMRAVVMQTIRGIIYMSVPSALGLLVMAQPVSSLILAHGNFDPSQLPLVVNPLIFFTIGLPGLALVEILTRSFYAIQDTRTPTQVSILQFMFSIGLSLVLLQSMGASGLALASSLAWTGEAVVLLLLLRPRLGGLDLRVLGGFCLNVLAASVAAALSARVIYTLSLLFLPIGPTSTTETFHMAIRVVLSIIAACIVYFGASKFLGIDDAMPLERIIRRVLRR